MDFFRTKFLLADDDIDDAEIFCEALTSIAQELECHIAKNGRRIFEMFSERLIDTPDVIFLDINMPIMNGWDCLKKLKESSIYHDIPVIMYSTSSAKRDVDMAYNLGASLFITKPDDFTELQKLLEIVATTPQETLLSHLAGFKNVKVA